MAVKTVFVASDTHGSDINLVYALDHSPKPDLFVFCGDGEGLEGHVQSYVGRNCSMYMVRGNCDYGSGLAEELTVQIGSYRAFIAHGHKYRCNMTLDIIADKAKSEMCDICFFGHTHRPFMEYVNGVLCINPGSLSQPRQFDARPSYMIIEVDDQGELSFSQKYID